VTGFSIRGTETEIRVFIHGEFEIDALRSHGLLTYLSSKSGSSTFDLQLHIPSS
jgi:hypothetical protein